MRTIYYKEAPENPESLKVLLKDYFDKGSPATYWSDDKTIQCNPYRQRSPDDLLMLANHYFPETTIKEVMNTYKSISDNMNGSQLLFAYCPTIKRQRLINSTYRRNEYPTTKGIFYSDSINTETESQWTTKELAEMIDD